MNTTTRRVAAGTIATLGAAGIITAASNGWLFNAAPQAAVPGVYCHTGVPKTGGDKCTTGAGPSAVRMVRATRVILVTAAPERHPGALRAA